MRLRKLNLAAAIGLPLVLAGCVTEYSAKDAEAPSLDEARVQGLLPSYDHCLAFYAELRTRGNA